MQRVYVVDSKGRGRVRAGTQRCVARWFVRLKANVIDGTSQRLSLIIIMARARACFCLSKARDGAGRQGDAAAGAGLPQLRAELLALKPSALLDAPKPLSDRSD